MRFPSSDISRLLDFIAGLQECSNKESFGQSLVALMSELIPATLIAYDQIDEKNRTYEMAHNAPLSASASESFLNRLQQVYQQNPIYTYIQNGGTEQVVDLATLTTQRVLQRTDFYQDIFKPLGIRHQVNVLLPRAGWITSLSINHDRPFTTEQKQLLHLASRHILLAHRSVCLTSQILESVSCEIPAPPQLTPREQEVLHWVSQGKRNGEIAIILSCSPRTVEKHLEHILAKRGVETRTAATLKTN